MATEKQLMEKRANLWLSMQDIAARAERDGGHTAESRAAWDRADEEMRSVDADIDIAQRNAALDARFNDIDAVTAARSAHGAAMSTDGYDVAFGQFMRSGMKGMNADNINLLQSRAQAVGTGSAGGYTVPQGFWNKVTETLKYFGPILSMAEMLNTDSGQPFPWATNDDTGNVGALLAENTQITAQDLTFGQKMLGAYTYTSKLILVSWQLLQDAGIDAEALVAKKIGQRLGRIYNTALTTGTGSAQPQGFITGGTVGATAASATALTFDDFINLEHSVDVAYRANGQFQMHDLVLAAVRKLKDSQGRYLWEPAVQAGAPSTLHGFPVQVNNDMASAITTGQKTVAFGDFNAGFVARQVAGGQLVRLEERYADFLQVGFFGFGRIDSLVQDASAFKILAQA